MRTLQFIVEKQIIKPDPDCDFTGLIPGTEGYLQAKFIFSPDWDNCAKVAGFYSRLGKEYTPQIIDEHNSCMIPAEALIKSMFSVCVFGQKNGVRLRSNKLVVHQNGGK